MTRVDRIGLTSLYSAQANYEWPEDEATSLTPFLHHGRVSSTKLNGVAVARRKRVKPPAVTTWRSRASPAWAPRAIPTSWLNDAGTQIIVEAAYMIRPTG